MKARRRKQIGARHVAWMRRAFRGGQARPANSVARSANPEPDGATRAASEPVSSAVAAGPRPHQRPAGRPETGTRYEPETLTSSVM